MKLNLKVHLHYDAEQGLPTNWGPWTLSRYRHGKGDYVYLGRGSD